jgi:sulfate/thiosulfate transport system permease protein
MTAAFLTRSTHPEASPGRATVVKGQRRYALGGLGLSLGYTVSWLSLIVLVPLSMVFVTMTGQSLNALWKVVTSRQVLSAVRLSFWTSAASGAISSLFGALLTWVLVRYQFPLKRLVDALVDLPFALPTAVAGVTLSVLVGPGGWIGKPLAAAGVAMVNAPFGIVIAMVFIGVPFVVRTLQPVLQDLEPEIEDAAESLGAGRVQVIGRVILPMMGPALVTGFTLAFSRALGEYGSVIFMTGNLPLKTEIAPVIIKAKMDNAAYAGAATVAAMMLIASFVLLVALNWLQNWQRRRTQG